MSVYCNRQGGDVLFVVFTEKDIIRLILARLATNAEKSIYYTKTFIIENGQKPTEAQLKEIIKIEVLGHFSSMLKLSALVGIIL